MRHSNQSKLIIKTEPISFGIERVCYAHPEDSSKLIKIPLNINAPNKQTKREKNYYYKLQKRKGVNYSHIPFFYGSVKTNLGEGMLLDFIKDYDGKTSQSLLDYLFAGNNINELECELEEFRKYFINNLIVFNHDMIPKNILVQKIDSETSRLVLIDGIGDTATLSCFNYFAAHVRSKLERRWNRFIKHLYDLLDENGKMKHDVSHRSLVKHGPPLVKP